MEEKVKIKYLILLVVFLIFAWIFIRDDGGDKAAVEISPAPEEQQVRTYSRISFFHSRPVKASLSIPEDWEGEYRMKESGDKVNFYYIGDPGKEILLFRINSANKDDYDEREGYHHIVEKGDYVFNYELSTDNLDGVDNKEEYELMAGEVIDIISSFKVF